MFDPQPARATRQIVAAVADVALANRPLVADTFLRNEMPVRQTAAKSDAAQRICCSAIEWGGRLSGKVGRSVRGSNVRVRPIAAVGCTVLLLTAASNGLSISRRGDAAAEEEIGAELVQPPILVGHKGGAEIDPVVWDARAEVDISVLIRRYLAEQDPPAESLLAADLEDLAARLERDGRARLSAAGAAQLRVA